MPQATQKNIIKEKGGCLLFLGHCTPAVLSVVAASHLLISFE
jgi:hypothetical protein